MRRVNFLSILFFTTSAYAANVWFDPPNPTSRTPVTAHVTVAWNGCTAKSATPDRHGNMIGISLDVSQCAASSPVDTAVDLGVLPAGIYDVSVGPGQLLVLIAEGTLVVRDADPPLTVSPSVAWRGGDPLTVKCNAAPCPDAVVTIGGTTARLVKQVDANTLVVTTPIHQPGIVDVVVTSAGQTWRATAAFDYFDPSGPFDRAFFEPVLFPVMINGPGALGSVWSTEASMRNENDYAFPLDSMFDFVFPQPPVSQPLPAHATNAGNATAPNGYLMYVPRQSAPRLWFGTLVKDLSRQAEALGTEIPVVREQDFFGRPFEILDVPTDPRYRVALRLYRIDSRTTMHLRILTLDSSGDALVDEDVALAPAATHAMLAITDLVAKYPQLSGKGSLLIEIDPQSVQPVGWGFVSVTNNETQHVTVVSPQ